MKKTILFLAVCAIFMACVTSNYTVSTYIPKEKVDFGQYKTFAYIDPAKGEDISPRMLSAALMAQSAISHEMQLRGFVPAKPGTKSDIQINLGTFTETKHEVITTPIAFYPEQNPLYWGAVDYDWRYDNVSYGTAVGIETYKEGTLLVDIVDATNKVLLWHGSVTQVLQDQHDEGSENHITAAVSTLFQKFPVKPLPSKSK